MRSCARTGPILRELAEVTDWIWRAARHAPIAAHDEQLAEHGGPRGHCANGALCSRRWRGAEPGRLTATPDAAALAAAYAFGVARNHPFVDGEQADGLGSLARLFLQHERVSSDVSIMQKRPSGVLALAAGRSLPRTSSPTWFRERVAAPDMRNAWPPASRGERMSAATRLRVELGGELAVAAERDGPDARLADRSSRGPPGSPATWSRRFRAAPSPRTADRRARGRDRRHCRWRKRSNAARVSVSWRDRIFADDVGEGGVHEQMFHDAGSC